MPLSCLRVAEDGSAAESAAGTPVGDGDAAGVAPASVNIAAVSTFDSRELSKAALVLFDIESFTGPASGLQGVVVISRELPWIGEVGKAVRTCAQTLLYKGMDTLNQAELGSALQVGVGVPPGRSSHMVLLMDGVLCWLARGF